MKQNKTMTNNLGQKMSVQTFGQQLFAIAKEVRCAHPGEFKGHHLIFGGFHTHCTYIAGIGKVWGTAGFHDILADSEYSPGSVDQILTGKQHNIGIRAMTLMYEALIETYIESFISWLQDESDQEGEQKLSNQLGEAHTAFRMPDISSLTSLKKLERELAGYLLPQMMNFKECGCKRSLTFQLWYLLVDSLEILLQSNQAHYEGNLDLSSLSAMLPLLLEY